MAIGTGVQRVVAYKKESTWGTLAGASGAQKLRRVQSSLQIAKSMNKSNEIVSNYQFTDARHGPRKLEGSIQGELSAKTWADFFGSLLRRDYAAFGTSMTGLSITISGSGPTYTVARAAGSWLTDGVKIGMVVRLSVGALNANNINRNLFIVGVTALNLTVIPDGAASMVAEGPIATTTATITGKITWVPQTGHTNQSYTIEDWHSVINQSEAFSGCRVSKIVIKVPASGNVTIEVSFVGKDVTTGTSQYFTTPAAETTTGVIAASAGVIQVGGATQAAITGLEITIDGNQTGAEVAFSNVTPDVFPGRVSVSGQFTAFFESATMRDLFLNETETSIICFLKSDGLVNGDFISIAMPRVKLASASKDDGEKGLVQTFGFEALNNGAGGTGIATEATTILMQDSAA